MPDALLKLEHVSKVFESGGIFQSHGKVTAVDDVTLDVWPGETLGIVGESGSGKSTLLRLMLRLLRPTSGRVLFEGADVWSLPARQLRRLRKNEFSHVQATPCRHNCYFSKIELAAAAII